MTVSNHRPSPTLAGRIRIPNDSKSRAGACFTATIRWGSSWPKRPGSRGSTIRSSSSPPTTARRARAAPEIPLQYHIPALIFAPGLSNQVRIDGIVADRPDAHPAVAARHGLRFAFLRPQHLRSRLPSTGPSSPPIGPGLSRRRHAHHPVARAPLRNQYRVVPTEGNPPNLEARRAEDSAQVGRAIDYYQTSCKWHKRRRSAAAQKTATLELGTAVF